MALQDWLPNPTTAATIAMLVLALAADPMIEARPAVTSVLAERLLPLHVNFRHFVVHFVS